MLVVAGLRRKVSPVWAMSVALAFLQDKAFRQNPDSQLFGGTRGKIGAVRAPRLYLLSQVKGEKLWLDGPKRAPPNLNPTIFIVIEPLFAARP